MQPHVLLERFLCDRQKKIITAIAMHERSVIQKINDSDKKRGSVLNPNVSIQPVTSVAPKSDCSTVLGLYYNYATLDLCTCLPTIQM